MSTPQEPARRRKQKARRTKQLAQWRAAHPKKDETAAVSPAPPAKPAPK
jgi:hypothetical protein